MDNTPLVFNMQFNVPVSKVWDALTVPEQMKEWYFDVKDYKPEKGNRFYFYEPGGTSYLHNCTILEFIPQQKFVHTWSYPNFSKGETIVSWELQPKDGGTLLTLTHSQIEAIADAGPSFTKESFEQGWKGFELELKHFVERPEGLKTLRFNININSTPEKLWDIMWDKEGYKEWTKSFSPGSSYSGNLELGGRIHFLSPEGFGMYSDVDSYIPNMFVAFKHVGNIEDFKEQPLDEATKKWTGCIEAYTVYPNGKGGSVLIVKVDTEPAHYDMMKEKFPQSLEDLKTLAEK